MEAQAQPIQSIFTNSSLFTIPYFQRQYVWNKENWERFWNDLSNLLNNGHIYFLGSLIAKNENGGYTLIDGQQRTTTLFLLLKALYMRASKNDMFVTLYFQNGDFNDGSILVHNKHDRPIFDEIMNMTNFADPLSSSGNVLNAWLYLKEKVLSLSPDKAAELQKRISKYVRFVYITLNEDDDEQQIFDTINSLGVDLTTGELLKNYFFDRNNEIVYSTMWAPVFERANSDYWSDSLTKGRIKESNIEQFFYALLQIAMCDPNYSINSETKKRYRLKDQVFANYKHLFRTQNIEQNKDPFIAQTVEYGKIYQSCFSKRVLYQSIRTTPVVKRLTLIMYARQMMSIIPYILYVIHTQSDDNEQQRIFNYIESYLVRRVVCGSSTNNYADLFSETLIGQQICTFDRLKQYIDGKDADLSLSMPSDQEVKNQIQTKNLSSSAPLLLYLLESKAPGFSVTLGGLNCYITEQLLPTKSDSIDWPLDQNETEDDRKMIAQTLGNFVLIPETGKLKASQRKNWATKSAALKPVCQPMEPSLHPVNTASMTPAGVKMQNDALADLICLYWPKDGVDVSVGQTQSAQQSVSAIASATTDDIMIDDVIPMLKFNEEDYSLTDYIYHSLAPTTFDGFIKKQIENGGSAADMVSALNVEYLAKSGITAFSRDNLIREVGHDVVSDLETNHSLYYIGKCKFGWVVTLDRCHIVRRSEANALADVITEARNYTIESVDGIWKEMKKDNQVKGILKAINEQQVLGLSDTVYAEVVELTNRFIGNIDESPFLIHPKDATSFDALRSALEYVFERRAKSKYILKYPFIIRMMYDIVNYIEDYYWKNGNIGFNFTTTKKIGKVRITYLDTGAAPVETSIPKALSELAARYTSKLRSVTVDGVTSFLLNCPVNPGSNYEKLPNRWFMYKISNRGQQKFLNRIALMLSSEVKVEFL